MSAGSVAEVLGRCASTDHWAVGMCGQFCAAMYGYDASGYGSAYIQWQQTPVLLKHPGSVNAPPGALLFWSGGPGNHGHVAVADGTGSVFSIDISGPGTVSRVPASTISTRWGLPYLGWAYPFFQGQEWNPAMIYGVDVASYQSNTVPATTPGDGKKVDYAFTKATQGTSYVNPRMAAQAASSRSQGMVTGFYHFLETGNIPAQARYFVDHAASQPGDVLALDWETNETTHTAPTSAEKDAAIRAVQALRPDHQVLLYCNTDFWLSRDTSSFAGDGLWIATAGYPAGKPPIRAPWLLHQYSTAGGVDHDAAQFASRDAMRAWAEGKLDMALSADDKAFIQGLLTATSLVDGKAHGQGYYLAHAEQALAAVAAQAKTNGSSLTALAQALATASGKVDQALALLNGLDLSQLPAEIAAKLATLKFVLEEQA